MEYTCDVCNYSTNRKHNFIRHEKSSRHLNELESHQKKLERKSKYKFVCELCQKKFPQKRDLERHSNRQTPCVNQQQVQNIQTQQNAEQIINNNINNQNNNNIVNNFNIDFSELKQLCLCKDEQYLLTHIEHKVEDIMDAQNRFNENAKEASLKAIEELEKENELEDLCVKDAEKRGVDYKAEYVDLNSYKLNLTDIIVKTFFDNNRRHMSLFREPDIENTGRWLVKHMSKAFDPQVLFNLVENCPEKEHFTSTCFEHLDYRKLADAYKSELNRFLKLLDTKRKGFNIRTMKD